MHDGVCYAMYWDEVDEEDVRIDFDIVRFPLHARSGGTPLNVRDRILFEVRQGRRTRHAVPACCVRLLHLSSSIPQPSVPLYRVNPTSFYLKTQQKLPVGKRGESKRVTCWCPLQQQKSTVVLVDDIMR